LEGISIRSVVIRSARGLGKNRAWTLAFWSVKKGYRSVRKGAYDTLMTIVIAKSFLLLLLLNLMIT